MKLIKLARYVVLGCSLVLLAVLIACSGATTSSLESPDRDTEPGPVETKAPDNDTEGEERETPTPPPLIAEPPPTESAAGSVPDYHVDAKLIELVTATLESEEGGKIPMIKSSQLQTGMVAYLRSPAKVIGVGSDYAQVTFDDSDYTAFVIGRNNVATGATLDLGLVKVEGVQQYPTLLGGQSSGYVLHSVSQTELERAVVKANAMIRAANIDNARVAIAEAMAKIDALPMRTWSDESGKFSVEAKLADVASGVCTLTKADGSTADVPIERLSEDDQAYVKDTLRSMSNWKREISRNHALIDRLE